MVVDAAGKRNSIDVLADSLYDAAHLYLNAAKSNRASCLPIRRNKRYSKSSSTGGSTASRALGCSNGS